MIATVLVTLDTQLLVIVSSLVIPLLHGVLSKSTASTQSKALLTVILTGVAGLVGALISDEGQFTQDLLLTWAATFVMTIASHYGLFKPFEITSSTGTLQRLTGGRGIAPLGVKVVDPVDGLVADAVSKGF